MKYILLLFLFINLPVFASQICGPTVSTFTYSYTIQKTSDALSGYWAVGENCVGFVDDDVTASCDTIVATGYATCDTLDGRALSIGLGADCHCARTHVLLNGQLIDSYGAWVRLGNIQRDSSLCQENCSRICAEEVIFNKNNYRRAIMTLPAI